MSRMRQKRKAGGLAEREMAAGGEPGEGATDDELEEGAGEGEGEPEEDPDTAEDADAGIDHPHEEVDSVAAAEEPADPSDPSDGDEADPDADLEAVRGISPEPLKRIVESLLFASDRPLALVQLRHLTGERNLGAIQAVLDSLVEDYKER